MCHDSCHQLPKWWSPVWSLLRCAEVDRQGWKTTQMHKHIFYNERKGVCDVKILSKNCTGKEGKKRCNHWAKGEESLVFCFVLKIRHTYTRHTHTHPFVQSNLGDCKKKHWKTVGTISKGLCGCYWLCFIVEYWMLVHYFQLSKGVREFWRSSEAQNQWLSIDTA